MKKTIIKAGWAMTRFGDKHNIRFLTYNPITWAFFFFSGRRAGTVFAASIRTLFPDVKSALDVGAGTGGYVNSLNKQSIRTIGVEYSGVGRLLAKLQGVQLRFFDCSSNEGRPNLGSFDMVFSIEVGEHIPASLSEKFVEFMTVHSNFIIFSAAHPEQGGHGHINEQPKDYWQNLFERVGFYRQPELEGLVSDNLVSNGFKGWLPINIMIFKKRE